MRPDRVSNPGPLIYESDTLSTALRGPAHIIFRHIGLGGEAGSAFNFHKKVSQILESFAPQTPQFSYIFSF